MLTSVTGLLNLRANTPRWVGRQDSAYWSKIPSHILQQIWVKYSFQHLP